MPIKEKSFRIGCGRYVQEPGALAGLGGEIVRLGSTPLVVGGPTALSLTREAAEASIAAVCKKYEFVTHPGTCNDERAQALAAYAKAQGFDVIVGIGGGVMMDFAKLIAFYAKLPVVNVPTSSATCAAYTPMSVCYTPEGRTVGTRHYDYEVNAVLVDTAILVHQPVRLLLAGVFDALAKFVEINQRYDAAASNPLGLDWAYLLAKQSYAALTELTEPCIADMAAGRVSDTVEQVAFTAIAVTGIISGIARGSNQCALAHKFYENTRVLFHESAKPCLHGEIVGVGLLLQNHYNGTPEENDALRALMAKYAMPASITAVGVAKSEAALADYYERLSNSSAIDRGSAAECARLRASLGYLWELA